MSSESTVEVQAEMHRLLKSLFAESKYLLDSFRQGENGRFCFELSHENNRGVTLDEMLKVCKIFDTTKITVIAYEVGGCSNCGIEMEYTLKVVDAHVEVH